MNDLNKDQKTNTTSQDKTLGQIEREIY